MRSLKAALPGTLKALGIARRTREAQAIWLWREVVGPELARETAALKLSGGTLWVAVSSTPLAHQLHLDRETILGRLNERIGTPVVREIRYRQEGRSAWR